MSGYSLHHGDCLDVLPGLPMADSIVTDPPAGVAFMGAEWDKDRGGRDAWVAWLAERLRAARGRLRPGGYALVWALPRTSHWTACAIEDAGLVIQDRVVDILDGNDLMREFVDSLTPDQHVALMRALGGPSRMQAIFGSGFPKNKSHLKPATEDWWLAYNPGGPRALNVEGCRVETDENTARSSLTATFGLLNDDGWKPTPGIYGGNPAGRWPPHLLLSHSETCEPSACAEGCPVRLLGEQSGECSSKQPRAQGPQQHTNEGYEGWGTIARGRGTVRADTGTAARFFPQFFYAPKASRRERNRGCEGMEEKEHGIMMRNANNTGDTSKGFERFKTTHQNTHPTVKPLALMRWLVRLVTPPGGLVLDPFMGSGSTGCAAVLEGLRFVGVEQSTEYLEIARARIAHYADPLRHMEAA